MFGWLSLSVLSLVFAGLFALLIVLARTPGIEGAFAVGRDYIYVALVGHVVLAFVIWFLAFEGFLWVYTTTVLLERPERSTWAGYAALALSGSGLLLVVVSAVGGLGGAELSNYVPVLLTPWFFSGLTLFFAGIVVNILNASAGVLDAFTQGGIKKLPAPTFGMMVAGVAVLVAIICFGLSWAYQAASGGPIDMEVLFWGGGHVLQFANTVSVVSVWLILARSILGTDREPFISPRTAKVLFSVYLLFILPSPFIYPALGASTDAARGAFTLQMQWGHAPATLVFIFAAVVAIARRGVWMWRDPSFSALLLSMLILIVGGFIGADISGTNTKIPAHYHSMIVAITIAFMALFYRSVEVVEKTVWSPRLSRVQPWLYGAGILLFVAGLYIAGSHGMERKAMAGVQNLDNSIKTLGMVVMGIGGIVAITGGVAFVVNALVSLVKSNPGAAAAARRAEEMDTIGDAYRL